MQKCWGNVRALQNLRIKNGIFIFRRKIPLSLQALIKRREIIKSLGRCGARQARLQAAHLWVVTERAFTMLTDIQNGNVEDADLVGPDDVKAFIDAMIKNSHYNDEYTSSLPDSEKRTPISRWLPQLELMAREARAALVKNDIHSMVDEMQELATELNIPVRRESQSEKLLGRAMLRAAADYYDGEAHRQRKERGLPDDNEFALLTLDELRDRVRQAFHRELHPTENDRASIEAGNVDSKTSGALDWNLPASKVWDLFVHDRIEIDKKKETVGKLRSSLNLWEKVHGDKPVKSWTGEMASALRRLYLQLPQDYADGKKWRTCATIADVAEAFKREIAAAPANERELIKEQCTKQRTWNRHRSTLSAFWEWAKRHGLTTIAESPFAKLWLDVDADTKVSDGGSETRINWDKDRIRELFASPIYTGFKSEYRRHLTGNIVVRDALYWVPLIIAFTGMRREEICQLRVEHLCQLDDIWYFDLKAKGLKLKKTKKGDAASKRWVPVPEALIQLGITESLHKDREPIEQLFPDLYRSAAHDVFGDQLGKDFAAYRKNYDKFQRKNRDQDYMPLYVRWMDLHSFRHTVCTELMDLGVPQAHAEEVTGHKSKARQTAFANYDKGRTLQLLKAAIEKRSLPIDIPRLVAAAARSAGG
jgi:integrase